MELRCVCGEPLAEVTGEGEVVTEEGTTVTMRRHTDYVVCSNCLSMYRVTDLERGVVHPVTDVELPEAPPQEDVQDLVVEAPEDEEP